MVYRLFKDTESTAQVTQYRAVKRQN